MNFKFIYLGFFLKFQKCRSRYHNSFSPVQMVVVASDYPGLADDYVAVLLSRH